MKLFRVIARVLIGTLFVGHGTQKLFGWFGGHGIEGTGGFFESLGLKPGRRNAVAAGVAEAGGGALLASGIATPLAGAALTGVMTTAIRHVHAAKGPWSTEGGWEYNAVLIGAIAMIVEAEWGPGWALASVGAGAAGSLASSYVAQREAEAEAPEPVAVPFERAPEREPAQVS